MENGTFYVGNSYPYGFIDITDAHVRIGKLFFINSNPSPHFDMLYNGIVRMWGGWGFFPDKYVAGTSFCIVRPEVSYEG
jgi:hypothetical protein